MRFISHRGNIRGKNSDEENRPSAILNAISLGYDCEIDLWLENDMLHLGHDNPEYSIESEFLYDLADALWVHCKNIEALLWCDKRVNKRLKYFWHETDKATLTSNRVIWAYPGNQPIPNSIAVMPELNKETKLSDCYGICSDYIEIYRERYEKV